MTEEDKVKLSEIVKLIADSIIATMNYSRSVSLNYASRLSQNETLSKETEDDIRKYEKMSTDALFKAVAKVDEIR